MRSLQRASSAVLAVVALSSCHDRTQLPRAVPTLHAVLSESPRTLDPALAEDPVSVFEAAHAYETLFRYDYAKGTRELAPLLAESVPASSNDGRRFVIRLRPGTLFQDDPCFKESSGRGREVVADDVIYTLKRLEDPALASPVWQPLQGWIKGLEATALDRFTVEIRLGARAEGFLGFLASPQTAIVAREAVSSYGAEFERHPVGTGPFRLGRPASGSHLSWFRNLTTHRPGPFVDRWESDVIPDAEARSRAIQDGAADLAGSPLGGLDVFYVAVNFADPVLGAHPELRQALTLANDPAESRRDPFGARAIPLDSPLPQGLDAAIAPSPPSAATAWVNNKALLNRERLKGLPLELAVSEGVEERAYAELVQRLLTAAGARVRLSVYNQGDFRALMRSHRGQLWVQRYSPLRPDPFEVFARFYGPSVATGANDSGYANPVFDRLYERARAAERNTSGRLRSERLRQLSTALSEGNPILFIYQLRGDVIAGRRLKGLTSSPFLPGASRYYRVVD